jgi:hypothetical protein
VITSIAIADPTTALMLTHVGVGPDGRVHTGPAGELRRRQRRYARHARLRKLLG